MSDVPDKKDPEEEIPEITEADLAEQSPEESMAEPAAAPSPAVPTPQPVPAAAPAPVPAPEPQIQAASAGVPVPLSPEQEAQQRTQQQLQFADDLKYGKIEPKTYHDLYANKGILGKAGTLFGLMLSGAGSGVTGQPNALLDMMNKEIERDLDAQKSNQSNKQSWYKAALEHDRLQSENALRGAETDIKHSEAAMANFRNQQAGIVDADALNNATIGTVQSFQNLIDKMPPGPQRAAAQAQQDGVIVPYFLNKAMERNLNAAQKKSALNAISPINVVKANPPPKGEAKSGTKYDAVNENRLNAMVQKGKFAPEAGDAIPQTLLPAINKEKEDLVVNRNNLADADDSFNALAKLKHAGQIPAAGALSGAGTALGTLAGALTGNPVIAGTGGALGHLLGGKAGESVQNYFERNRAIQVEALKSRLGGNMSEEDKNKLANALLPSWTDTPDSMTEAHRKMLQHFESNAAEAAPNLTRFGLKYPLPNYPFKPAKEKQSKQGKGAEGDF